MKNVFFIISQPRSGSSMLQQIISSHLQVKSLPEPWFMLPFAYMLKNNVKDKTADYNYKYFHTNFDRYLNQIDSEKEILVASLRNCVLGLYSKALEDRNELFFLDKTPRYYHIIPEIKKILPDSKIILLSRNPLNVFSSMLSYNFNGNISPFKERDRICDLLLAPYEIIKFKENPSFFFIKYEDIIKKPKNILPSLFEYLNLSTSEASSLGEYTVQPIFANSEHVDTKSSIKHNKPVKDYLDSWKESIDDFQKKMLAKQYITKLGKENFEKLGYSYEETLKSLKAHKVRFCIPVITFNQLTGEFPEKIKLVLIALYRIQKYLWL